MNGIVRVVCSICDKGYSHTNVARLASEHFKDNYATCVGQAGKSKRSAPSTLTSTASDEAGPSSKRSKGSSSAHAAFGASTRAQLERVGQHVHQVAQQAGGGEG